VQVFVDHYQDGRGNDKGELLSLTLAHRFAGPSAPPAPSSYSLIKARGLGGHNITVNAPVTNFGLGER
jgi:hypothetical protein